MILVFFAGFRNGESMPDYQTYTGLYEQIVNNNLTYFIETSFVLIVKISNATFQGNLFLMFLFYAIIGVLMKAYSIIKLSHLPFYSIVVYVSNYFILQEMIQIRAGVATGFILISIIPLYNRNLINFLFCLIFAIFFHYSSIIFIFLWFIKKDNYSSILYVILIILAYFLAYTGMDPITLFMKLLPANILNLKSDYFEKDRAEVLKINILGIFILTRILILSYFIYFSEKIKIHNKFFIILLKFYTLGIIFYITFSRYPEIAVRTSYTLMASEIIIIPTLIYTIIEKKIAKLVVILYSFLTLIFNIYFTSYFKWEEYFN